jgi:predicted nucleic acid-binding protein
MPGSAEEISNHTFQATDELLLDTNVWFFLYGPHRPGSPQAAAYSGALARILTANSRIYVDVLIISEFVNRYARLNINCCKVVTASLASSTISRHRHIQDYR